MTFKKICRYHGPLKDEQIYFGAKGNDCKICKKYNRKKWTELNKEKNRMHNLIYLRKMRCELNDTYIKKLLCEGTSLSHKDIPQAIVELKREHLKMIRMLVKLNYKKQAGGPFKND